mmetsp:Transcript_2569/g.5473  ORF Transcript_2569/g.5473 Transcript_2569/m.5473 type:complete len:208 (+) Transcript_2569:998-1621(+)
MPLRTCLAQAQHRHLQRANPAHFLRLLHPILPKYVNLPAADAGVPTPCHAAPGIDAFLFQMLVGDVSMSSQRLVPLLLPPLFHRRLPMARRLQSRVRFHLANLPIDQVLRPSLMDLRVGRHLAFLLVTYVPSMTMLLRAVCRTSALKFLELELDAYTLTLSLPTHQHLNHYRRLFLISLAEPRSQVSRQRDQVELRAQKNRRQEGRV